MRVLRRELGMFEVVAVSVALMSPTLVAVLVGAGMAGQVGVAAPITMVVTAVGVMLVAYSFVRLTKQFNHAGSTYALTGVTLGPRAGFFAGYALMGVYVVFCGSTIAATGLFGAEFLDGIGLWPGADWVVISLVGAAVVAVLACSEIRSVSRSLLSFEGIAIVVVLIVSLVIIVRVIAGTAPGDQSFSLEPLNPSGLSSSGLGPALVLGFFSWAGFEAAAALGEETSRPRRNIPIAVIVAVLVGAAFYVFAFYAQILGYGATPSGIEQYVAAGSPLGDLAKTFIGSGMGDVINLAAFVSAFAGAIAAATAAGRLVYAMARDGFGPHQLARLTESKGTPAVAIVTAMSIGAALIIGIGIVAAESAANTFFYLGSIASLSLLIAYAMTNAGALRYVLTVDGPKRAWESLVLVAGIAFVGFVLFKSVIPVPASPYDVFPYIVGGYLAIGLAIAFFSPQLAERVGAALAREDGFEADGAAPELSHTTAG